MYSYDGILDGKIAELKSPISSSIDAVYSNFVDADRQKAHIVCIKIPDAATYNDQEIINFIRNLFYGTHLTTKGKTILYEVKNINEVIVIDKANKIWTIKK